MSNFLAWLLKNKTIAMAIVGALTVGAQIAGYFWHFTVPEFVYLAEGAVGITAVRVDLSNAGADSGWKTFVVAGATAVTAVLSAFGVVIPPEVLALIGVATTGSVGHAISKVQ